MPFWWGQHVEPSINVVTKTVTLYVVYRLRRAMVTATARMNETNGGNGVATSAANRTWRLPRATIFSFHSTRARLVACSASLLAVTWQGQAVYMLLNERGKAATASQVDAETVFSAFNSAVNFSMHGAAFFLFHTVLSFQSRAAYSRLRELHILAGAFAGLYSFALCSHLYFFRSSRSPGNDASSLMVLMVVRGVVCWFYALAFTLYSPEDLDADQEDYDIRVRFRLDEGDAREVYSAVSLGASKLGHDDDDGGGDVGNLNEPRKASVDGHDEDILLRTAGKVGTPCPADIATRIDLRGKHGQVAVILAGSVWSLYVILMNIVLFQPLLIRDKGHTMTRVAVHPLGFGITFHAAYLMTLFGWHGFFTGNLVTLDVGRNFALSTLILTVVLAILVPSVGWLALSMGLASLLVVVMSTMYANLSSKWSTDPLKTWRR